MSPDFAAAVACALVMAMPASRVLAGPQAVSARDRHGGGGATAAPPPPAPAAAPAKAPSAVAKQRAPGAIRHRKRHRRDLPPEPLAAPTGAMVGSVLASTPAADDSSPAGVAGGTRDVLTTAAAIRALSPDEAALARPVRIRGVITCAASLIFIQDETAGIFVDAPVSTKGRYVVGQFGELEGFTAPGLFAPQIVPKRFTVKGNMPLPPARPSTYDELSTGKMDSQRVEIRGIIRAVMPDERRDLRRTVTLKMASDDGVFPVYVVGLSAERLREVTDASVLVRGVMGGVFNERRQMIGIKLYVGRPEDLLIEEPGPAEPFSVPATPVDHLLRFQPEGTNRHRVRVSGVVTLFQLGTLFLQDGTGGVAVSTRQGDPLAVGDRVDVLGFPTMGDWAPELRDAIYRRAGPAGSPAAPIQVTAEQELSVGAHDSRLISLEADLVDVVSDVGRRVFVLKSKNNVFDAELHRPDDEDAPKAGGPLPGSHVRLTGVCVVRLSDDHTRPGEFRILLRTPDDLVVLQQPPWWTLARLMWGVGFLALLALFTGAWAIVLRRRLRGQTRIIREQLGAVSAAETRYRELFDTAIDMIYTHDLTGRFLTVNRAAEVVTEFSRAELLQRSVFDLVAPEERRTVREWLDRLATGDLGRPTIEATFVTKHGRQIAVEISARALGDHGRVVGIEGIARDTSERRRARAALSEAHERLSAVSRRAGLADVSADVLHNVGTAVDELRTGMVRLSEHLGRTSLSALTEAIAALPEGDAPPASPPPGEVTEAVASVRHLTGALAGELALVAGEVGALARGVEHVSEVVAMQRGYARLDRGPETTVAEALVEDVLRIHRQGLERDGVTVVRDFSAVPSLVIDKQKVLQILVHLINHARTACASRPFTESGGRRAPARITLRIETPGGARDAERIRIVVADNGTGIGHESLTRIFEPGLAGSAGVGEGLPEAFASARDLGGNLSAHSDGVGRGTRFTLELPVRPPVEPGGA